MADITEEAQGRAAHSCASSFVIFFHFIPETWKAESKS